MGMSDCEKCWDTPCSCGWDGYISVFLPVHQLRALSYEDREALRALLVQQGLAYLAKVKS